MDTIRSCRQKDRHNVCSRNPAVMEKRNCYLWCKFMQGILIDLCQVSASLIVSFQFVQLDESQCCSNFINAVVVAQIHYIIAPCMTFVTIPGESCHAM